jgi:hypothetical protein
MPDKQIPVKDWIPEPVFDSSDYLDRPDPVYDRPESLGAETPKEKKP